MIRRALQFLISLFAMIVEQALQVASGYLVRRTLRKVFGG